MFLLAIVAILLIICLVLFAVGSVALSTVSLITGLVLLCVGSFPWPAVNPQSHAARWPMPDLWRLGWFFVVLAFAAGTLTLRLADLHGFK